MCVCVCVCVCVLRLYMCLVLGHNRAIHCFISYSGAWGGGGRGCMGYLDCLFAIDIHKDTPFQTHLHLRIIKSQTRIFFQ